MDRDTINERREIEDRAMALGEERTEIKRRLAENTSAIVKFLDTAVHHVPLDHLARYLQVGRATLYRWLEEEHRNANRRGDDD